VAVGRTSATPHGKNERFIFLGCYAPPGFYKAMYSAQGGLAVLGLLILCAATADSQTLPPPGVVITTTTLVEAGNDGLPFVFEVPPPVLCGPVLLCAGVLVCCVPLSGSLSRLLPRC